MYSYFIFFYFLIKIIFRLNIKKPAASKTAETAINTKQVSNVSNTKENSQTISNINDLLGTIQIKNIGTNINNSNSVKNDKEIINSIFCGQQNNSGFSKQINNQNYKNSGFAVGQCQNLNNGSNFFDFAINKNNYNYADSNQIRNHNLQKGTETVNSNDLINSN